MLPGLHKIPIGVGREDTNEDVLRHILNQETLGWYETNAILNIVKFSRYHVRAVLSKDPLRPTLPDNKFWHRTFSLGLLDTGYTSIIRRTEDLMWSDTVRTVHATSRAVADILDAVVTPYAPPMAHEISIQRRFTEPMTLAREIAALFLKYPVQAYRKTMSLLGNDTGAAQHPKVNVTLHFRIVDDLPVDPEAFSLANLRLSHMTIDIRNAPRYDLFSRISEEALHDVTMALASCSALQATWYYFSFGSYPAETALPWYPRSGSGSSALRFATSSYIPRWRSPSDHNESTVKLYIASQGSELKRSSRKSALEAFLPLLAPKPGSQTVMSEDDDAMEHYLSDEALARRLQQAEEQAVEDAALARILQAQFDAE